MTVNKVTKHVKLDWKTIKKSDKMSLETKCGQADNNNLKHGNDFERSTQTHLALPFENQGN